MRAVLWTLRARADLAGIRSFISQDSPHFASVVLSRIIVATDRLSSFPESGRVVPEVGSADIREVIHAPYRIVYRIVAEDEVHILTVHHGARQFPRPDCDPLLAERLRRWSIPLSLAAVVVLSVTLVTMMREEGADRWVHDAPPLPRVQPPGAEVAVPAQIPPAPAQPAAQSMAPAPATP